MKVHILSNGIKPQGMKNKNGKPNKIARLSYCTEQKLKTKLENTNLNGENDEEH